MYPFKSSFKSLSGPQNVPHSNNMMSDENQWPNQATYQHIDLEKVDWAALAQQWISMKESCGPQDDGQLPMPPPPPNISVYNAMDEPPPPPIISSLQPSILLEEKGEAPMEVEREEDESAPMPAFAAQPSYAMASAANADAMRLWTNVPPPPQLVEHDDKHRKYAATATAAKPMAGNQLANDQNESKTWFKRQHAPSEFKSSTSHVLMFIAQCDIADINKIFPIIEQKIRDGIIIGEILVHHIIEVLEVLLVC